MSDLKRVIIIVDPFSTGRFYAPLFSAKNYHCIAVISSNDIPNHLSDDLQKQDFLEIFIWNETLLEILINMEVVAVVAGCETGVYLADYLTNELEISGNPLATTESRRHKHTMQKALEDKGLKYIPSILITKVEQINKLIDSLEEVDYVVKPVNSAATDGVILTHGHIGVKHALENSAWNKKNDLGEKNLGFIIQPFISGKEYVVDLVAFNGKYIIASVCEYNKIARNGGSFVYDSLNVLDPFQKEFEPLLNYAVEAANALDVQVGPIHMEIIWSSFGPVMIEAGSRLHGGIAPKLFSETYKPNLLELSVQSYLSETPNVRNNRVELVCMGKIGFLYSDEQKPFVPITLEDENSLKRNSSYLGHKYFVKPGMITPITTDFATCPGLFWLCHRDFVELEKNATLCRKFLSV
jgi:biotin carboxylase